LTEPSDAPAATLSKLSWIEDFVNDLLDPAGRDLRRRAIEALDRGPTTDPVIAAPAPTKPAYRRGWLVATVTKVLTAADKPMQAQAIHRAVTQLAGEPVSWSSVRNCLAEGVKSRSPRFERVGHGRYRTVSADTASS
jgi:hypothetical protein